MNSIVRSPSVAGKVEVVSEENVGTDIKVIFEAELPEEGSSNVQDPFFFDDRTRPPVISFLGFKKRGRGVQLLNEVLHRYLISWWGFTPQPEGTELGEIVIVNEDPSPIATALEKMENHRSFIILSSSRGSPRVIGICNAYENSGGFCRIVHKPGGPFRLRQALKQLLRARQRRPHRLPNFTALGMTSEDSISLQSTIFAEDYPESTVERHRRGSIDNWRDQSTVLSSISGVTVSISPESEKSIIFQPTDSEEAATMTSTCNAILTVEATEGLLNPSVGSDESNKPNRKVLVVEDNSILRNLLCVNLVRVALVSLTLFAR